MLKPLPSFLLDTDNDFNILLEALDTYNLHAWSISSANEVASTAIREVGKLTNEDQITEKEFQARVQKNVDTEKVALSATTIRDQIIVLKAKVVCTKEYLRQARLGREIASLTDT